MYLSDFLHVSSTHELLYLLFRSEVGLSGVTSPTVQFEALTENFKRLQSLIVDNLKAGTDDFAIALYFTDGAPVAEVPLKYSQDAQLFKELYTNFNQFDEADIWGRHVNPLVGEMIMKNPTLRSATGKLLAAHVRQYGVPVGERICATLMRFDLAALIPDFRSVMADMKAMA